MPNKERGTWVGLVGPDGAGKSALVEELLAKLEADGFDVVHTHGRPQSVAPRTPPARADPSKPQAGQPRGLVLSLAKYLLAVVDFMVARRRLLRRHDVWLCERPLLDYEVDPARYQLDERLLPVIRRLNRLVPGPDDLLLLSGDAQVMADRKAELSASEIDRQLEVWQRVSSRVDARTHALDTTSGDTVEDVADAAAGAIRTSSGLKWRIAPVKPTRLDVRFAGSDIAALDTYRPIRFAARSADTIGRMLTKTGLTPRAASPDPAIDALVRALSADDWQIAGVSAMASSAPDRWIVGLANHGRLTHVLKVGPATDQGLVREVENLGQLRDSTGFERIHVPRTTPMPHSDRTVVALPAIQGRLAPVTDPEDAAIAAAELADNGWTHGDLAPWNLFHDEHGRLVLLDWEEAEQTVRPLWDIVHYLSRLGSTTNPDEARAAFTNLIAAGPSYDRLLVASDIARSQREVSRHAGAYLSQTEHGPMSSRENALRGWMRDQLQIRSRSST